MVYANACLIKKYGFLFSDRHDDNIIIANVNFPRIYKLGTYYVYFDTPHMFFMIDAQVTVDIRDVNGSKRQTSLITTKSHGIFTDDVKPFIEWIKRNNSTLDNLILHILPQMYKKHLISQDEAKNILVSNPNVKLASYLTV